MRWRSTTQAFVASHRSRLRHTRKVASEENRRGPLWTSTRQYRPRSTWRTCSGSERSPPILRRSLKSDLYFEREFQRAGLDAASTRSDQQDKKRRTAGGRGCIRRSSADLRSASREWFANDHRFTRESDDGTGGLHRIGPEGAHRRKYDRKSSASSAESSSRLFAEVSARRDRTDTI